MRCIWRETRSEHITSFIKADFEAERSLAASESRKEGAAGEISFRKPNG